MLQMYRPHVIGELNRRAQCWRMDAEDSWSKAYLNGDGSSPYSLTRGYADTLVLVEKGICSPRQEQLLAADPTSTIPDSVRSARIELDRAKKAATVMRANLERSLRSQAVDEAYDQDADDADWGITAPRLAAQLHDVAAQSIDAVEESARLNLESSQATTPHHGLSISAPPPTPHFFLEPICLICEGLMMSGRQRRSMRCGSRRAASR